MSNYFLSVGKSSSLEGNGVLTSEGADLGQLLKFYKETTRPIESNLKEIDTIFMKWCDLLFNNYNIVAHGCQSKFRLLESFHARYLKSGRIPDFKCLSPKNGTTTLNVKTVKLHGFTPVSLELFCHSLFGSRAHQKESPIDGKKQFLNGARKSKTHYVFMIHTFELFYENSRPVCDLIFQLYREEPNYMHLLVSVDHVCSGKIMNPLKFQLQLIFFHLPYGESFLHEKVHRITGLEGDRDGIDTIADSVFAGQLNLQSIKDIYQAVQNALREIMVYIFEQNIEINKLIEVARNNEAMSRERTANGRSSTRRTTAVHGAANRSTAISFNNLLNYCETKFLLRRANLLREHLSELIDHGLIAYDDNRDIDCLVSVNTCKKFLESLNQMD